MLELGPEEAAMHREVGEYAAALPGIDLFITMGTLIRNLERPLIEARRPVFHCDTTEEAVERLTRLAAPGDVVLLKDSNGMRLDLVREALKKEEKFTN